MLHPVDKGYTWRGGQPQQPAGGNGIILLVFFSIFLKLIARVAVCRVTFIGMNLLGEEVRLYQ